MGKGTTYGVIYGIYHVNRPDLVRYVGQTSRTLEERAREHRGNAGRMERLERPQKVARWMADVGGENVDFFILEEARDYDHLQSLEEKWIRRLWSYGMADLNVDPGGSSTPRGEMSIETKKKIAKARSRFTEADVLQMQELHLRGWMTKEIADYYNSPSPTIQRILRGERWSWVRLPGFAYTSTHWKLAPDDVRAIRERLCSGETHQSIAEGYGVSRENISRIHARKTWQWLD
jgi:hypothetical protein